MPTSVTRASGTDAYVSLANGNFLPEIWSMKLQAKFYAQTSLDKIANHDWQGEISGKGSKVEIRVVPTVNVSDYDVNGTISYQELDDDKIELTIDHAKVFAFKVDDIDQAQADIKVINESTRDASKNMKIAIEKDVYGAVYADATTSATAKVVDDTNVLDWIIDSGTSLDEYNAPDEGRWLLLPPWICGMIKKSDLKDASLSHGDPSLVVGNGYIGMIDNFMIFKSNTLARTDETATADGTKETYHCMAGTRDAITFASQFVKVETLRLQDTFGDAVRGLNVYGYKVAKEDALVHMPASKTAP